MHRTPPACLSIWLSSGFRLRQAGEQAAVVRRTARRLLMYIHFQSNASLYMHVREAVPLAGLGWHVATDGRPWAADWMTSWEPPG